MRSNKKRALKPRGFQSPEKTRCVTSTWSSTGPASPSGKPKIKRPPAVGFSSGGSLLQRGKRHCLSRPVKSRPGTERSFHRFRVGLYHKPNGRAKSITCLRAQLADLCETEAGGRRTVRAGQRQHRGDFVWVLSVVDGLLQRRTPDKWCERLPGKAQACGKAGDDRLHDFVQATGIRRARRRRVGE